MERLYLRGREVFEILEQAGIDISHCRRIVLDVPYNDVVKVYREDIDSKRYITGIMEAVQKGEQIRVEEVTQK